jgi:hypothetical protein
MAAVDNFISRFEAEARARKVARLVEAIEALALLAGSNPYQHPDVVARLLRTQPPELWIELARRADVRVPSAETIAEVIATFERRAQEQV